MRSRWRFGSCCWPPVFQLSGPHGCHNVTQIVQNLPLPRAWLVIHFPTNHKAVPCATAPSHGQQRAQGPSKRVFQNNPFPSAFPQATGGSASRLKRTTDIVFQLATNHTCLCTEIPLWSLQRLHFSFPLICHYSLKREEHGVTSWSRISGGERQLLHRGVGSAFEKWKTGPRFSQLSRGEFQQCYHHWVSSSCVHFLAVTQELSFLTPPCS